MTQDLIFTGSKCHVLVFFLEQVMFYFKLLKKEHMTFTASEI